MRAVCAWCLGMGLAWVAASCGDVVIVGRGLDGLGPSDTSVADTSVDTGGPAEDVPGPVDTERDTPLPEDAPVVCTEPQERECGGACAVCPSDPGIAELGCLGTGCVALACAPGFFLCDDTCCEWAIEAPDQSGFVGQRIRVAVGEANDVHLVYHFSIASPPADGVRWARRVDEDWLRNDVGMGGTEFIGFALGPESVPHIALNGVEGMTGGFLHYTWPVEAEGWKTQPWPTATVNPIDVVSADVAVDGDGHPAVLFRDEGVGTGALKLAILTYEGEFDPWQTMMVSSNIAVVLPPHNESLDFDSMGQPHVAYFDGVLGELRHAVLGEEWIQRTVATSEALSPSIAVGNADHPRIAYTLRDSPTVFLATLDTEWESEPVAEAETKQIALALGPNGEVHIAFVDASADGRVTYVRRVRDEWRVSIVDPDTEAGDLDLAVDQAGRAHIAYQDLVRQRVMYARQPF